MTGPVRPIAAASGDPKKTLRAPADCVVTKLHGIQTAMNASPGQPLVEVETAEGRLTLTAPAAGLIVYIPAREGLRFKHGDSLVLIL